MSLIVGAFNQAAVAGNKQSSGNFPVGQRGIVGTDCTVAGNSAVEDVDAIGKRTAAVGSGAVLRVISKCGTAGNGAVDHGQEAGQHASAVGANTYRKAIANHGTAQHQRCNGCDAATEADVVVDGVGLAVGQGQVLDGEGA